LACSCHQCRYPEEDQRLPERHGFNLLSDHFSQSFSLLVYLLSNLLDKSSASRLVWTQYQFWKLNIGFEYMCVFSFPARAVKF
jgi:hypothetical protein